jgi:uncharacterized protein involved in exopolysaccharide biosynthesis
LNGINDMNNPLTPSLSRRDLCEIVFRHKKKVVFLPLITLLAGFLVILYFPRTYRSQAQVFLRLGRENIGLDPTATTGQTVLTHQGDRKDEVASVINVIQSRGIIAQAVDRVGIDVVLSETKASASQGRGNWLSSIGAPLQVASNWIRQIDPVSPRERAIVYVEKRLRVNADRGSTLISISYDAKTPQTAQRICSAIVDIYQHEHMRIHRSEASRPFFEEQYNRLRKQLDDALEAVRLAKNEVGLSSVEQRRQTLEAHYDAVELARLGTQQKLAAAQARIADLEQQLANVPERLVESKKSMPNSGADLLRQQLYLLQTNAMDLRARYSESHPLVQAVDMQIKEAQGVLAEQSSERMETTDSVNPIHRQLSLDLKQRQSEQAGLEANLVALNEQKSSVLSELRVVNDQDVQLDQLNRQVELARSNFMHYAQNMEEARLDKEMEAGQISNLSVVEAASLAEKPVKPSKLLVALATLILAATGAPALIVLSEVFNDRLRSDDDVIRSLELPVFASIPRGRRFRHVASVGCNGSKQ